MDIFRAIYSYAKTKEAAWFVGAFSSTLAALVAFNVIDIGTADEIEKTVAALIQAAGIWITRANVYSQATVEAVKAEVADRASRPAADVPLVAPETQAQVPRV
jgi:hypothetical protein